MSKQLYLCVYSLMYKGLKECVVLILYGFLILLLHFMREISLFYYPLHGPIFVRNLFSKLVMFCIWLSHESRKICKYKDVVVRSSSIF